MQSAEDDEDQRQALGKAIVIRRTELGLSRNDLKDRSGLSYPYVAELEKGSKRMSASSLQAMSEALELRPAELLAMADSLAEPEQSLPPPPPSPVTASLASMPMPKSAAAAPAGESRWFRARQRKSSEASDRVARTEDMKVMAEAAAAAPPAERPDEVDAMLALADQRIRAIVRDELRRAGIDPGS
jgi:transcriptional regulator with XRE-family HTH domain